MPSRSEQLAGSLRSLLAHGCSNHGCVMHRGRRGIGTCGPCRCLEAIYDLALELACELEPIKRRRGIDWVPYDEYAVPTSDAASFFGCCADDLPNSVIGSTGLSLSPEIPPNPQVPPP
jgi:hypothetical protein